MSELTLRRSMKSQWHDWESIVERMSSAGEKALIESRRVHGIVLSDRPDTEKAGHCARLFPCIVTGRSLSPS
tara:strand:- start:5087 stop:5302 length:216 start_codon:yes stop_codon:yes gene_type:complete